MIIQAKQFCEWFEKKKIKNKFRKFDLSTIKKKYEYFSLLKELDNSKIKLFFKIFIKFFFKNFIKICAIIFFPKKLIFNFMNNV